MPCEKIILLFLDVGPIASFFSPSHSSSPSTLPCPSAPPCCCPQGLRGYMIARPPARWGHVPGCRAAGVQGCRGYACPCLAPMRVRPKRRADEHQQTKARLADDTRGERYQIGLATVKYSSTAMADRRDEIPACVRFRQREMTRAGPTGAQGGGAAEGKRNRTGMD